MSSRLATRRKSVSQALKLAVWQRDGWLCHWCKRPVIFPRVMKYLELEVRAAQPSSPVAYYHAHWTRETSALLDELGAVVDHLEAESSRSISSATELVTSCNKCNGRKSDRSLEIWDRRFKFRPVKGKYGDTKNWDGLSYLFLILTKRHQQVLSAADKTWIRLLKLSQTSQMPLTNITAEPGAPR